MKIGWQGDSSCIFCGEFEIIDHLLVTCSIAKLIWEWIATFNNFHFHGQEIEDLRILDSCIPLKDKILVEFIRNAVCWVLWLTQNKCIFDKTSIPSIRSIGLQIINLAKFWCTARNTSQMLNLTLILSREVEGLPLLIGEEDMVMVDMDQTEGLSATLGSGRLIDIF
jgi:hypothetical protein